MSRSLHQTVVTQKNLYTDLIELWAASHDSSREDCEENFRQNKAEKPQEYFVYFKV
jgi:hypothetical protein